MPSPYDPAELIVLLACTDKYQTRNIGCVRQRMLGCDWIWETWDGSGQLHAGYDSMQAAMDAMIKWVTES